MQIIAQIFFYFCVIIKPSQTFKMRVELAFYFSNDRSDNRSDNFQRRFHSKKTRFLCQPTYFTMHNEIRFSSVKSYFRCDQFQPFTFLSYITIPMTKKGNQNLVRFKNLSTDFISLFNVHSMSMSNEISETDNAKLA